MKLSEACSYTKGKKPPILNGIKTSNTSIPYINIKAFEKGIYDEYTNGDKCNLCNDGDILMVWDGARCGMVGKAKKGAVGSTLMKITPKPNVLNDYLYYFLDSQFYILNTNPKGVGIPHIEPQLLWNLELRIPSIEEQAAIVAKIEELFSELESGKQQLLKAQEQLKVYRQSLLKAAFEGKLTNDNVKEGELPEGWKWVKLGEVVKNVEYGSASKSAAQGKVPVLRMGNIQNGRFVWNDLVYTDDEAEIEKYLLKTNDVLFNRTNSADLVGKTAIFKGERTAIFAGYLIRVNVIQELLDAAYLTNYLNSYAAKQYGNTVRSFGVNQSNINGTKLKTYPIPLPALSEQLAIVTELEYKLSVCDKIEESISLGLQQAELLRQSILKKAFKGELQ